MPLALFTWRAMHAPVNFDGGMNLQVAENLADGDGYVRAYDGERLFPREVQTNGPFMWLAAGAIRVLGSGQLAHQFANLAFVAGFLAVVAFVLRRESLPVRLVGPGLVLLAAPMIATYGLSGVGEVPMTFFVLCALAALVEGVRTPPRGAWWALAGSVAFGAAVTTKTVAVGAAGAVLTGLLCVAVAAPTWGRRALVVLAGLGAALVPLACELYRLASLGSMDAYRAWWEDQGGAISTQSGLGASRETAGPGQTLVDHLGALAGFVDVPRVLVGAVVALPLMLATAALVRAWRARGLRATLRDPALVLILTVGTLAVSYLAWYLLVVPDDKLRVRRVLPGLFALHLLCLLLVPWVVRAARTAWGGRARGWAVRGAAAVFALVLVAVTVPYGASRSAVGAVDLVRAEQDRLDASRAAADHVRAHPELRWFGVHWWSAPVVSLMSDTDFHDLLEVDRCTLDPSRDRLVWDWSVMTIQRRDPSTRGPELVYELVAAFGSEVEIYAVGPAPGTCD